MQPHPEKKTVDLVEPLTRRELEILRLMAAGQSNAEIAGSLSLALSSVKWYAQQIYSKLGVDNRKQAVASARELGLLDQPGHPAGTRPVAADLPQLLSPPATWVALHHNLPAQLSSFIGREKEITALHELFLRRRARLVTLTGSGGTGKTRLALRAAEQLLDSFPQGVWLVELAPIAEPLLVPRVVAKALGVAEDPQRSIEQVLTSYLRDRRMLLILDNCEHVVDAAAALAAHLLQACSGLRILATSREILGVEGEAPFRCPSLFLPRGMLPAGELAQCEAVRLFIERVQNSSPGFTLNEGNAALVARVCQRLDGIPLAIELAAARMRMLSLEQIAARLDQAFRLLTGGSRSVLPRHQTLKALIDWSYNLLAAEEKALLLRLSVFAGGWRLEAAEQVCADQTEGSGPGGNLLPGEQILDLLGKLADKSLIQVEPDPNEEPRYRMLETVRQYAHDRLVESGGAEGPRERHLDYFLDLSLRAQPHVRGWDARRWLEALDRELDNLRLALEWSLVGSVVKGLGLAAALHWLWQLRAHGLEGMEWLDRLLAAEELYSTEMPRTQAAWIARGRALYTWNYLAFLYSDLDTAQAQERGLESQAIFQKLCDKPDDPPSAAQRDMFRRDLALAVFAYVQDFMLCRQMFQSVHDPFWIAECDMKLTFLWMQRNDLDKADFFAEEQLALRQEMGDRDGEAMALYQAAMISQYRGNLDRAVELADRSVLCFETAGNREMIEMPRSVLRTAAMARGDYRQVLDINEVNRASGQDLGRPLLLPVANASDALVAWALKEYERAVLYAHEALKEANAFPFDWQKIALYVLGRVALSQGDFTQAGSYLSKALTRPWFGFMFSDYQTIQAMGVLAAAQQQHRRAAALFGAQEVLAGWVMNIICPAERAEYNQALAAARAALGDDGFAAAWAEGCAMTEAQAWQYATLDLIGREDS